MGLGNFQEEILKRSLIIDSVISNDNDESIEKVKVIASGFYSSFNNKVIKERNEKLNKIRLQSLLNDKFYESFNKYFPNIIILNESDLNDICREFNLIKIKSDNYIGYLPESVSSDVIKYRDVVRLHSKLMQGINYDLIALTKVSYKSCSRLFTRELKLIQKELDLLIVYRGRYFSKSKWIDLISNRIGLRDGEIGRILSNVNLDSHQLSYDDVFVCTERSLCMKSLMKFNENDNVCYTDKVDKLIIYCYLPDNKVGIISTYGSMNHAQLEEYKRLELSE